MSGANDTVKAWITAVARMTNDEAGGTIGVSGETARGLRAGNRKGGASVKTLRKMEAYLGGTKMPSRELPSEPNAQLKTLAEHVLWIGGKLDLLSQQIIGGAQQQRDFIQRLGEHAEREQRREIKIAPYVKMEEPKGKKTATKGPRR